MKGHLRKRAPGSWTIVLDLGRDANGKRRQKWVTVRGTKREAEAELARLVHESNTGQWVEPSKITVGEYLEKWLALVEPKVAPKTHHRYAQIVRGHLVPALGGIPLAKLTPLHVEEHYQQARESGNQRAEGGLSERTLLHHHRVLKEAMKRAVRLLYLPRNPLDAVDAPKPGRTKPRPLTRAEAVTLLEAVAGTRLEAPVRFGLATGVRRGEMLALRWSSVDLATGVVRIERSVGRVGRQHLEKVPKSSAGERRIALGPKAVAALREHKATQAAEQLRLGRAWIDEDRVFPNVEGSLWPPESFASTFSRAVARCGLKGVRFHDLRHTHATELLRQRINPKVVSERLGHSTVTITLDLYGHVLPGMDEEVAALADSLIDGSVGG